MIARLPLAVVVLIAISPASAQADLTVDITKITCYRAFFIGKMVISSHSIALWLSGYYHGQHGKTVVDMTTLERDARRMVGYCRAHRNETLGKAVQDALGPDH